jgi:multicomponent Na+:H+ antiporter subunit F
MNLDMFNLALFDFERGLDILITIVTLSVTLCFVRLYLGPDIPDRTVAFDTIAIHAVGILALYGIRINAPSLLDVALVTAVLGFLGTTMMARYLERAGSRYYAIEQDEEATRKETEANANAASAGRSELQSS